MSNFVNLFMGSETPDEIVNRYAFVTRYLGREYEEEVQQNIRIEADAIDISLFEPDSFEVPENNEEQLLIENTLKLVRLKIGNNSFPKSRETVQRIKKGIHEDSLFFIRKFDQEVFLRNEITKRIHKYPERAALREFFMFKVLNNDVFEYTGNTSETMSPTTTSSEKYTVADYIYDHVGIDFETLSIILNTDNDIEDVLWSYELTSVEDNEETRNGVNDYLQHCELISVPDFNINVLHNYVNNIQTMCKKITNREEDLDVTEMYAVVSSNRVILSKANKTFHNETELQEEDYRRILTRNYYDCFEVVNITKGTEPWQNNTTWSFKILNEKFNPRPFPKQDFEEIMMKHHKYHIEIIMDRVANFFDSESGTRFLYFIAGMSVAIVLTSN